MMERSFRASSPEIDRYLSRVSASTPALVPERHPLEFYMVRARVMRVREIDRLSVALVARAIGGAGWAAEALGRRLRTWAAARLTRSCAHGARDPAPSCC